MAQPTQVKYVLPNNDFCVIDNSAASTTSTLAGSVNSSPIGFDTPTNNSIVPAGSIAQGANSFGDTGTVLLDSVNDTVYADPTCATFPGNPVSLTAPTFKTVTKVLTNPLSATILFKNPA